MKVPEKEQKELNVGYFIPSNFKTSMGVGILLNSRTDFPSEGTSGRCIL